MRITYKNKRTEKLCNDIRKATKELGKGTAEKLHGLINVLESFPNLYSLYGLPQYRMHPLFGNLKSQYSFVIDKGTKWRLTVYPLDEKGSLLVEKTSEKEMLIKAVWVELLEVSDHYE